MKRITVLFAALLLPIMIASAKQIKIRGYVTEIHSPTSFDIDDYRITRDQSLALEFEKEDDDSDDLPKDVRIGTEVEIKGDFDDATHELHAKSIKIYPADTRKLKRTAILEQVPDLKKIGSKWEGSVRIDGQTLIIDETTAVSIVPNATQKKALKQAEKARKKGPPPTEAGERGDPRMGETLCLVLYPDLLVTQYECEPSPAVGGRRRRRNVDPRTFPYIAPLPQRDTSNTAAPSLCPFCTWIFPTMLDHGSVAARTGGRCVRRALFESSKHTVDRSRTSRRTRYHLS